MDTPGIIRNQLHPSKLSARDARLAPPHGGSVGGQRPGPHAKSGCQRWRYIAQRVPAARAASFVGGRRRGIRTQPVPPGLAQLIDALHRESWQILHPVPPD